VIAGESGKRVICGQNSASAWVGWKSPATLTPSAIAKSWRQVVTPSPDEQALLRADFELFRAQLFRRAAAPPLPVTRTSLAGAPQGSQTPPTDAEPLALPASPTQIGKCGFYLRPAFVARILRGK